MYELHKNEQYFFDEKTLEHLADFLSQWTAPCCLCAPMLGKRLAEMGVNVTVLDIDERFKEVKGFRRFDIYRPDWIGIEFDVIFCDPPFFNASLSQLFGALRLLSRNDFSQPMLVAYLARRSNAIKGTFSRFELVNSGYFPSYQTVRESEKNRIEIFSNLSSELITTLNGDDVSTDRGRD